MIDFDHVFKVKALYDWVIFLADETKNPQKLMGTWGAIRTQSFDELKELLKNRGSHASNWGPRCGINDLFSFDFDWPWVYEIWLRQFRERAQTLTYKTPNGGARVFFYTDKKVNEDPFKKTLHVEYKGNHYVAVGGEALDQDGVLRPYVKAVEEPILRDNQIIRDTTRYFSELLEDRYSFLTFHCIQSHFEKCSKRPRLSHDQSLAINAFMMIGECDDWEIHNFRKGLYDYDGKKGKHKPEYDRGVTEAQIKSGRKYVEKGGLPQPCAKLAVLFNHDLSSCAGCSRRLRLDVEEAAVVSLEHITEIENPSFLKRMVSVEAIVSSTSMAYAVPKRVKAEWYDSDGFKHEAEKDISFTSSVNMKIAGASSVAKHKILSSLFPEATRNVNLTDLSYRTVYTLKVRPPIFTLEKIGDKIVDEKGFEYKSYSIYVVSEKLLSFPASSLLTLTGIALPDPKTQKTTLLVVNVELPEAVGNYDEGKLRELAKVFEGMAPEQRGEWVLDNFEKYSLVIGRRNVAKAVILGYFTPTWIQLNGETQRGWCNILIIGDTTTGKTQTYRKAIQLLRSGALITAETASSVGLVGAATQNREGWSVDWGFLVLNDRRLLGVDGAHKLMKSQWAALAESERSGVVTIAKAAKDTAYARTRQIKIANPIDPESNRYETKSLGEFYYPVLAASTFLDLMSVARLDLCVFVDSSDVKAEEINKHFAGEYASELTYLGEAVKWVWSDIPKVIFHPEAEDEIYSRATELYNRFFCKSVPLASIDLKWKIARLSSAFAALTMSTTDFETILVEKQHVAWVANFLDEEYTNTMLHSLVEKTRHDAIDEEEAKEILKFICVRISMPPEIVAEMLEWIAVKGRFVKEELKDKYNLSRDNQLQPLVTILSYEGLIRRGSGFYPTPKLNKMCRILSTFSTFSMLGIDIPHEETGGQRKL